jgi:hypothetical protein
MEPVFADAASLDVFLGRFLQRFSFVTLDNVETLADRFAVAIKARLLPRDPFHLLPLLGMEVQRDFVPPPARAEWKRDGGCYRITVSRHHANTTANFALWLACFQILAAHPRFPTALSDRWRERLGNKFAAAMLMPREEILAAAEKFRTNPECLVPVLANKFAVSWTAMRKRLQELNALPRQAAGPIPRF